MEFKNTLYFLPSAGQWQALFSEKSTQKLSPAPVATKAVLLFLHHFRNRQGRIKAQLTAVLGLDIVDRPKTHVKYRPIGLIFC